MAKKYLFKSGLIIIFIFFSALVFAESYGPVWGEFYELATTEEEGIFPRIIISDPATASSDLKKADSNDDSIVNINEFFDYYDVPRYITSFVHAIDDESSGIDRSLYSAVLDNLAQTEERLGPDYALDIFYLFLDYFGVEGLASADSSTDIMNFLEEGIYTLPPYIRRSFFDRFTSIITYDRESDGFQTNYFALVSIFQTLREKGQLNEDSANDIMGDIEEIQSLLSAYPINATLGLYEKLYDLYVPDESKSSGPSLVSAIEKIVEISKSLKRIASSLAQDPENLLANALEVFFDLLDRMSPEQRRELISDDWNVIVDFLEERENSPENERIAILTALQDLESDKSNYFAVKSDLDLYLNSFFQLQYKTSISLERIVYLFNDTSILFSDSIVNTVASGFSTHEEFVQANKDKDILEIISLAEEKTEALFDASFHYILEQTDSHVITLHKTITVYQVLAPSGLSFIVNQRIPLRPLDRVIEFYEDTLDYHLPFFGQIYVTDNRSDKSLQIINGSFHFHTALAIEDIETMKSRLESHFYSDFLSLLDISRDFPDALLPLTEERKQQLFRYCRLVSTYNVDFEAVLRFDIAIYSEKILSADSMDIIEEILVYLGDDKAGNRIFVDHFLSIIETLHVTYGVSPLRPLAFTVIDIFNATGYARAEVARILKNNIGALREPIILDNIREISQMFEYSPDVFITFDAVDLSFSDENLTITASFLEQQNIQPDIKKEIYIYALRQVNNLFAANSVYDRSFLQGLNDILGALSAGKRRTIIFSLPRISFLQKSITSPQTLVESLPALKEMDKLESDIYEGFLLTTLPAFNAVMDDIGDLKSLFQNLEAINLSLKQINEFLTGKEPRNDYFTAILPKYAAWATSAASVTEIHQAMISALKIWKGSSVIYFQHLKDTFPLVVVLETSPDIAEAFAQLSIVLSAAHNQQDFTEALKELSGNFFRINSIGRFTQFFLDIESNKVAIEYAKENYFQGPAADDMAALDTLLNNYFQKRYVIRRIFSPLAYYGFYSEESFDRVPDFVGGRIDFAFPFTKNFQSFNEVQFLASLTYLFLLDSNEHEGNISIGFLVPFLHAGLSQTVDFHLVLSGNFGIGFDFSSTGVKQKGILAFADLGFAFDFRRSVRLGVGATIMRISEIGAETAVKSHRIGATIMFTSL